MIEFRDIELQDKEIIDKFFTNNPYSSAESCFSNLYGWAHKYKTQYAIWRDFLLVKFTSDRGGCSYLTRANYDYIYTSEKLINLSGKKLQSKRNHINRFKAQQTDWKYISITENPAEAVRCKKMLQKWYDINKESSDESLEDDFKATSLFLDNFEAMKLKVGAIEVNGEIIAFSMGAHLNEDTFIVHVEKAFADIQGAYPLINQQFVLNEASEYTYINREEDMGLPSLRKAKLSYRPDILLEKYIVKEKNR